MLVDFYHLDHSPLERVLPSLSEKVLSQGERLLIVAEPAVLIRLDAQLWTYSPDSFLPHGRDNSAGQPVLLSERAAALNGSANVALADGRWRDEALDFSRAFYLFDNERRDEARESWKALKDHPEVERRYWKQDERGKWVQGP